MGLVLSEYETPPQTPHLSLQPPIFSLWSGRFSGREDESGSLIRHDRRGADTFILTERTTVQI